VDLHPLEILPCQLCLPQAGFVKGNIRSPAKDFFFIPCRLSVTDEVDRGHLEYLSSLPIPFSDEKTNRFGKHQKCRTTMKNHKNSLFNRADFSG
jgi:hypothetical protein